MSSSPSVPSTIKDFTVLPILYKSFSSTRKTEHFLYLKEHIWKPKTSEGRETYPKGRTLFVVNTPPDSTERELRLLFQSCGHIERVILQGNGGDELVALAEEGDDGSEEEEEEKEDGDGDGDGDASAEDLVEDVEATTNRDIKKKGKKAKRPPQVTPLPLDALEVPLRAYRPTGSTAYVIFAELGAVSNALELRIAPEDRRLWPPGGGNFAIAPTGLAHYEALHAAERPSLDAVKKHADSYLEVYEYNQAILRRENKSKYKKGEAIVDEDGFTLVARGGAYGKSVGGGVGVASKAFMKEIEGDTSTSKRKKKKNKHEKDDFYKFQIHEKRRQGEGFSFLFGVLVNIFISVFRTN